MHFATVHSMTHPGETPRKRAMGQLCLHFGADEHPCTPYFLRSPQGFDPQPQTRGTHLTRSQRATGRGLRLEHGGLRLWRHQRIALVAGGLPHAPGTGEGFGELHLALLLLYHLRAVDQTNRSLCLFVACLLACLFVGCLFVCWLVACVSFAGLFVA